MSNFLYRGVSKDLHEKLKGVLRPKESLAFARHASWDNATWDDSDWAESDQNGIVEHQFEQLGLPTSGISTTPHLHRAIVYATHDGKFDSGYVYVIDRNRLVTHGVQVFVVNERLVSPSIPEDDEVILVASDFGAIPADVIVEIRPVGAA